MHTSGMRYASMPMLEGGDSSPTSVYGSTPLHPGAASSKRQTRCTSRLFSSEDLRTPEPLEKLLSTIETGRDEIGGNVVRLKAWLSHQQHEVQGWLRKQQPIETRRLEAVHELLVVLHSGQGDVLAAIDQVARLDNQGLAQLVPQLCDVVLAGTGQLDEPGRELVRRALLALCSRSQHAALLVCWYLRATLANPTSAPASVSAPRPH